MNSQAKGFFVCSLMIWARKGKGDIRWEGTPLIIVASEEHFHWLWRRKKFDIGTVWSSRNCYDVFIRGVQGARRKVQVSPGADSDASRSIIGC